jgi:hypothetical protein
LEFLENPGVLAAHVVVDGDRFKVGFDEFDEGLVREDFGPKVTAAFSSGDFLEEKKDGLTRFFGSGEGGLEVAGPFHRSRFHRLVGFGLATG